MKTRIILTLLILLLPCITAAAGGSPEDSGQGIFVDSKGRAAGGADVVAYFDLEPGAKAVMGADAHSYEWKGAVWQFSSAKNLEKFRDDPEKYSPQYGGYCAFAIAEDNLYGINPDKWDIHNGKLYLNYSNGTQKKWNKDRSDFIRRGDENWPKHRQQLLQAGS
jgi:YHS domain-containing protein